MTRRSARTVALIAAAVLALAASFHDGGDSSDETTLPPSVSFSTPGRDDVLVREASFEITGRFSGSVTTIELAIDGVDVGPARRGDPGDWRFPASSVSLAPGLHEIRATATGEGGTSDALLWVFYEPDPSVEYELRIVPPSATYEFDRFLVIDRPQLLLLGPSDDPVAIDLIAEAPPEIDARVNARLTTGSLASVNLDARGDPPPGDYRVVVRGVSESGFEREATHVVTITGPPPTTEPPPTTAPPTTERPPPPSGEGVLAVLVDDFEGPDRWTATVITSTNGAQASAEPAAGGNPGGQRRMEHVLPGTADGEGNPTQITVLHVFTGEGWNPSTDGALTSVDYAEDQIEFDPPFEGAAIGARFAIVQDGVTYLATINESNAFRNTAWQTTRVEGLTPADFSPAPGPDFSASGSEMTFGYVRSNTSRSAGGITTRHGIDNWTVELRGTAP